MAHCFMTTCYMLHSVVRAAGRGESPEGYPSRLQRKVGHTQTAEGTELSHTLPFESPWWYRLLGSRQWSALSSEPPLQDCLGYRATDPKSCLSEDACKGPRGLAEAAGAASSASPPPFQLLPSASCRSPFPGALLTNVLILNSACWLLPRAPSLGATGTTTPNIMHTVALSIHSIAQTLRARRTSGYRNKCCEILPENIVLLSNY